MDLREMLEEEGHEVVGEARDGAEAIELARSLTPDIVFMDINMPERDGIEAAEVIGEERIAPVVMVTAFSQASYVEQAAAAGAMAYVVKPFTRTDILPAMQLAVARFAEARALAEEVADLSERLETRKVVDRAKGLLMARGMCEPDAFKRLQKLAMDKRKPLRDVAEAVILASRLPSSCDATPRRSSGGCSSSASPSPRRSARWACSASSALSATVVACRRDHRRRHRDRRRARTPRSLRSDCTAVLRELLVVGAGRRLAHRRRVRCCVLARDARAVVAPPAHEACPGGQRFGERVVGACTRAPSG